MTAPPLLATAPDGRLLAGALVVMLVGLPVANSLSAVRESGGAILPQAITYLTILFVATLLLTLFTILVGSTRGNYELVWPRSAGEAIFAGLLAWLFLTYVRVGEYGAARNVAVMLVIFLVLCFLVAQGRELGPLFRLSARIVAILSVVMYLVSPTWYVNTAIYFSGKVIDSFPNVQGILHHGNITALFFGAALVVEVAIWGYRSRIRTSMFFVLLLAVLLMTTQGRNAILATAVAAVCVVLYRKGAGIWAWLVLVMAFAASWMPLLLMIPVYLFGGTPSYEWMEAMTNRGGLWSVIVDLLPEGFLLGLGSGWVTEAHPLVTDRDITEVTHAHNQVLDLVLVGGLPALVLYAALFCAVASRIRNCRPPAEGVGLMIVVVCTTITESPLAPYVTHAGVVLMLFAVVLVFAGEKPMVHSPDSRLLASSLRDVRRFPKRELLDRRDTS